MARARLGLRHKSCQPPALGPQGTHASESPMSTPSLSEALLETSTLLVPGGCSAELRPRRGGRGFVRVPGRAATRCARGVDLAAGGGGLQRDQCLPARRLVLGALGQVRAGWWATQVKMLFFDLNRLMVALLYLFKTWKPNKGRDRGCVDSVACVTVRDRRTLTLSLSLFVLGWPGAWVLGVAEDTGRS